MKVPCATRIFSAIDATKGAQDLVRNRAGRGLLPGHTNEQHTVDTFGLKVGRGGVVAPKSPTGLGGEGQDLPEGPEGAGRRVGPDVR